MNRYLRAILDVHTEWGPDAAGATSDSSPQGDPGGARRRPRLCYLGQAFRAGCRWKSHLQGQGLTAIILRLRSIEAARGQAASSYSWTMRPSMPPATTTTWPVTWPESSSEARTTTWRATSSGRATLRSAIVLDTAWTRSSSTSPRVIGDSVHPGATAFTRPRGAMRTISFFKLRSNPTRIADFAAA